MQHLMLDLEFLGKPPLARLCTIGAVFFDPKTGELGARFYVRVNWAEETDQTLPFDASTVAWWMTQPDAAAFEILTNEDRYPLFQALHGLSEYIAQHCGVKDVQVWGNGSDCDCVILDGAYKSLFLPVPWQFWNTRDVRTIVQLARDLRGVDIKRAIPLNGTKHHGLHDAIHQAQYVSHGFHVLGGAS